MEVALVLARLSRALVRSLVERQVYECLTLDVPDARRLPPSACRVTGVQVREIERAELARLSADPANEIKAKFLRSIEGSPDLCFGAFAAGQLVSYLFLAPAAPTAIDQHLRFTFPGDRVYVYKAFTLPAWRRRGLLPHLLLESMRRLAPRRFVTLVVAGNRASKKAFEHCGFQPAQRFPVWRLLSRPWPARAPDDLGFSIHLAGRETLARV